MGRFLSAIYPIISTPIFLLLMLNSVRFAVFTTFLAADWATKDMPLEPNEQEIHQEGTKVRLKAGSHYAVNLLGPVTDSCIANN